MEEQKFVSSQNSKTSKYFIQEIIYRYGITGEKISGWKDLF